MLKKLLCFVAIALVPHVVSGQQVVGPSSITSYQSIEYYFADYRKDFCCWDTTKMWREKGALLWSYETNLSPTNPNEFLLTFSARINWHDFEIILSQNKEGPKAGEVFYSVLHGSSHGVWSRIRYGIQTFNNTRTNTMSWEYRDVQWTDSWKDGMSYTTSLELTNYWIYYKNKRIVFGHGKVPAPKALDYLFDGNLPRPTVAEGVIMEWKDSITSGTVPIRGFGFGCNWDRVSFRDIKLFSDPSVLREVASFRYVPPSPLPTSLPLSRYSFQSTPRFVPNPELIVMKFAILTNTEFHILLSSTYGYANDSTFGFEIRGEPSTKKVSIYRISSSSAFLIAEGTLTMAMGEYWLAYNNDKQFIAIGSGAVPEQANIPFLLNGNTNYPLRGNVFNTTFQSYMKTSIVDTALAGNAGDVLYQTIQYLPNPDEIHPMTTFWVPSSQSSVKATDVFENVPFTLTPAIFAHNIPSFVRPQDVTFQILYSWNGNNFTISRNGRWVTDNSPTFTLDEVIKGFVRWTPVRDWSDGWANFMVAWKFPHTKAQTGRMQWYVLNVDTPPFLRTPLQNPFLHFTSDGSTKQTITQFMLPGRDSDNPDREVFYAFTSSNLPGKFRFAREIDSSLSCQTAAVGRGRFVTIYYPETSGNHIGLAEIQILAPNGTNIAKGKPVTASSIFSDRYPHSNFVDDVMNNFGHLGTAPFGSNNWLTIDLGSDTNVTSIVVYNRQDCCKERITGAFVKLTTAAGTTVFDSFFPKFIRDLYKFPLCIIWDDAAVNSNPTTFIGNQRSRFDQEDVRSGQVEFVPNSGVIQPGTYSAVFKLCSTHSVNKVDVVCSPDNTLNIVISPGSNQPPVLRTANAYAFEGQRVLLTTTQISVVDRDTSNSNLVFSPSIDQNFGSIELRRNQSVTANAAEFTYQDVVNGNVYFVPGSVKSTGSANPVKVDLVLQDRGLSLTLTMSASLFVFSRKVDPIVQKVNLNNVAWLQGNRLGYVLKSADLRFDYSAGDDSDIVYRLDKIEPSQSIRMQRLTTTWVDVSTDTTFTQLDIASERVRLISIDDKVVGITNVTFTVGSQLAFDAFQAQKIAEQQQQPANDQNTVLQESELEKTIRLLDTPLIQNNSMVAVKMQVNIIKTYSAPNCLTPLSQSGNAEKLQTEPFLLDKTILFAEHPDFGPEKIFLRIRTLPAQELAVVQVQIANTTEWSQIGVNTLLTQDDILNGRVRIVPDSAYHGWMFEIMLGIDVFIRNPLSNDREETTLVLLKIRITHPNEAPTVGAIQPLKTEFNTPKVFKGDEVVVADTEHSLDEIYWISTGTDKGLLQVKPSNSDWVQIGDAVGVSINVTQSMVQNGFVRFVPVDKTVGWTSASFKVCDILGACSEPFTINIEVAAKSSESTLYAAIGGSTAALILIGGGGLAIYMRSIKKQDSKTMALVARNQQQAGFDIQLMLRMFAEGFVNMKKQLTRIESTQASHSNMLLTGPAPPQGLLMGPDGTVSQNQMQQLYSTSMSRSQQNMVPPMANTSIYSTMSYMTKTGMPGGTFMQQAGQSYGSMPRVGSSMNNVNGPYGTTPVKDLASQIQDLENIANVLYGNDQNDQEVYEAATYQMGAQTGISQNNYTDATQFQQPDQGTQSYNYDYSTYQQQ